jgi:hypothetical protein
MSGLIDRHVLRNRLETAQHDIMSDIPEAASGTRKLTNLFFDSIYRELNSMPDVEPPALNPTSHSPRRDDLKGCWVRFRKNDCPVCNK